MRPGVRVSRWPHSEVLEVQTSTCEFWGHGSSSSTGCLQFPVVNVLFLEPPLPAVPSWARERDAWWLPPFHFLSCVPLGVVWPPQQSLRVLVHGPVLPPGPPACCSGVTLHSGRMLPAVGEQVCVCTWPRSLLHLFSRWRRKGV